MSFPFLSHLDHPGSANPAFPLSVALSLIRSGAAIPFTALAAPPTMTLSRVKALTQGTTSQSFLDVVGNVVSSADAIRREGEDTWLSRLKASRASSDGGPGKGLGSTLVYYGVDLWLDLYPDVFDRHEGFFDFYLPVSLLLAWTTKSGLYYEPLTA